MKVWSDVDHLAVTIVGQQLAQYGNVPLPADDEHALAWLRMPLHQRVHSEIAVPPARACIGADKIVELADMICREIERTVQRITVGVVCAHE